jgi:hypothetical protein
MFLKLSSLAFLIIVSALAYGAFSTPAQAYLDPGAGSMLLQLLLGGAAGVALVGRLYWHRFLVLIGVRREAPPDEDAAQAAVQSKPQAD